MSARAPTLVIDSQLPLGRIPPFLTAPRFMAAILALGALLTGCDNEVSMQITGRFDLHGTPFLRLTDGTRGRRASCAAPIDPPAAIGSWVCLRYRLSGLVEEIDCGSLISGRCGSAP